MRKDGCFGKRAIAHSTSGNPLVCNSPESSTNILTLLRIGACVWHIQLQFGKLAQHDIIHEACYCNKQLFLKNVCISKMFCALL
jgi:hypothetical protein